MSMFPEHRPYLKLRSLWLAIGYALVFFVVYQSIASHPIQVADFPYQDKVFHALAYFTLMAWFAQIYHDKFQRNMIALVLFLWDWRWNTFRVSSPAVMPRWGTWWQT